MSTPRFRFTFRDGCSVVGPVQGAGGCVSCLDRVRMAVQRAGENHRTGLYEPRPGVIVCYPDFSAESNGPAYEVVLAEVVEVARASAGNSKRRALTRNERKPYKAISAAAWRLLVLAAKSNAIVHAPRAAFDGLVRRGLISDAGITELGRIVYSRLSAGPACHICGRPLAFERRTSIPGGAFECLPCGRRLSCPPTKS